MVLADFCKQTWKTLVNIKEFLIETMLDNHLHSKACREKQKFNK